MPDFSTTDWLGLARSPRVAASVAAAFARFGARASWAELAPLRDAVEARLARMCAHDDVRVLPGPSVVYAAGVRCVHDAHGFGVLPRETGDVLYVADLAASYAGPVTFALVPPALRPLFPRPPTATHATAPLAAARAALEEGACDGEARRRIVFAYARHLREALARRGVATRDEALPVVDARLGSAEAARVAAALRARGVHVQVRGDVLRALPSAAHTWDDVQALLDGVLDALGVANALPRRARWWAPRALTRAGKVRA